MENKCALVATLGLLLAFLTAVPTTVTQQVDGTISCTATDPSGSAIPNADVTMLNVATGVSRTVRTNEAGNSFATF